mmetsp:Transcript_21950/g.18223  ORF Transcript_21950/g.18223 Transcript_21950/m.18223 type:complete len:203 (+) Transcript_21950:40-648(+)
MAKTSLRRKIRNELKDLSPAFLMEKSNLIHNNIGKIKAWRDASAVGVFLSMPAGEIQTYGLVSDTFREGKRVFVPKTLIGSNDMEMLEAMGEEDIRGFEKTPWGIPEPDWAIPSTGQTRARALDTDSLDVIIVPGLAFDENCQRLGRGKGYYDRYLSRWTSRPILIGVAFECQVVDEIPVSSRDVPVDYVVTESRIIQRRPE